MMGSPTSDIQAMIDNGEMTEEEVVGMLNSGNQTPSGETKENASIESIQCPVCTTTNKYKNSALQMFYV